MDKIKIVLINAGLTLNIIAVLVLLTPGQAGYTLSHKADHVFPDGKKIYLLNKGEGQIAILNDQDEPYFKHMTPLEIAIRMRSQTPGDNVKVSRKLFKKYCRDQVLAWSAQEKKDMIRVLINTYTLCYKVNPSLIPREWRFIKTSGKEEGGAYYTRGKNIIIPKSSLRLLKLPRFLYYNIFKLSHETFHVYSRYHKEKREAFYKIVGFKKNGNVQLGDYLNKRKITNPDGINYSYRITVKTLKGQTIQAIMMIYSRFPGYQKGKNNLFTYLKTALFEVRLKKDVWTVVTDKQGKPKPIKPSQAKGFYEQIGRNTDYIIHPEEIVADNVALLVIYKGRGLKWRRESRGLRLMEKIEGVLKSKK